MAVNDKTFQKIYDIGEVVALNHIFYLFINKVHQLYCYQCFLIFIIYIIKYEI